MSHANTKLCSTISVVILGFLGLLSSPRGVEARQVANSSANGVISGSVTADQGEVRAFRVKAKDTVHLIAYTVYTNKGKYHIYNLPPSTYQIQVMEDGFASPMQSVELKAGEMKNVDVVLKAKPPAPISVKLVDYDTLYPPSPARAILEERCMGCHGNNFYHKQHRTRDGWAGAVSRMFHVPDAWPQPTWIAPSSGASGGYNPADAVTEQEKQLIIDYFADNFGPDSEDRDLKKDTLVRDEDALAQAIYVQYELPPVDNSKFPGLQLNRGTHDVMPSSDPRWRGTVWMAESGSSAILGVNTLNLDPKTRTREWMIHEPRAVINVAPNALTEHNGHVYWTELKGDVIGDINIETGEMHRYPAPTAGQDMHGIQMDSHGDVWYAGLIGVAGRFDPESKKFTEWQPAKGGVFYTLHVDKKDRVWEVSTARRMLVGWDPKTEKWTTYKTPDNIRRITEDSKGKLWLNEYLANAVTMFDPDTKQMTEYKLPLKYGDPYEACADKSDNIWLENEAYQSFVRFDPRTKKFTYFPYPDMKAHTPKMEADADGTLWSGLSGPNQPKQLTGFKPNGNVPMKNVLTGKK